MRSLVALLLVAGTACGDDDEPARTADAGPPGELGELAEGQILVHEVVIGEDLARLPQVVASIFDPRIDFYQLESEAGGCRSYRFEPAFCGDCYGVCAPGGECHEFVASLSAGTLAVTGTSEPLSLTEEWGYRPAEAAPAELFEAGDLIQVEATGGADVAGFSLAAEGSDPIWLDLEEGESYETGQSPGRNTLRLEDGADLSLSWSDPVPGAVVHLELRGTNQSHGQPLPALIVCEAEDVGSLTVPGAMIESFPSKSYETICQAHDCPRSSLTRVARDRVEVDGRTMELSVASEREFVIVHD